MPLWEFSRPHLSAHSDKRARMVAALLTGVLYAGLALLAWGPLSRVKVPAVTREITATLLPNVPKKRVLAPQLPKLKMLRAENLPPPVITIAPPLPSGIAGNGQGAGTGSGGGSGGGCLDAVWMRAVSARVGQFFYYPPAALAVRRTGLAIVHFQVARNGQIESLAISKSSGDAELDKAAMDIVQKAQPLPLIPERMHASQVEGELPINFGVRSFSGGGSAGTC